MNICIEQVTAVTPALEEAFDRLLPQLSPRLVNVDVNLLRRVVDNPMTTLFAARGEERIIGVLTLAAFDTPSSCKAWIEDVVVDASARGCGVGEMLMRAAMAHALSIGVQKVMLTSAAHRTAAHALYKKMGFEQAETSVFVYKIEKI